MGACTAFVAPASKLATSRFARSSSSSVQMISRGSIVRIMRPESYWFQELGSVATIAKGDDRYPVVVRFEKVNYRAWPPTTLRWTSLWRLRRQRRRPRRELAAAAVQWNVQVAGGRAGGRRGNSPTPHGIIRCPLPVSHQHMWGAGAWVACMRQVGFCALAYVGCAQAGLGVSPQSHMHRVEACSVPHVRRVLSWWRVLCCGPLLWSSDLSIQ